MLTNVWEGATPANVTMAANGKIIVSLYLKHPENKHSKMSKYSHIWTLLDKLRSPNLKKLASCIFFCIFGGFALPLPPLFCA